MHAQKHWGSCLANLKQSGMFKSNRGALCLIAFTVSFTSKFLNNLKSSGSRSTIFGKYRKFEINLLRPLKMIFCSFIFKVKNQCLQIGSISPVLAGYLTVIMIMWLERL